MFVLCMCFFIKVFGWGGAHSSTAFRGMRVFFFFHKWHTRSGLWFVHPTCIRLWCHPQRCPISPVHGPNTPSGWQITSPCLCVCFLFLRCPAVGHVLAWWLGCCKMRPGSACGGWLFAVTVYWIMVTVARWFVIWWLTG